MKTVGVVVGTLAGLALFLLLIFGLNLFGLSQYVLIVAVLSA